MLSMNRRTRRTLILGSIAVPVLLLGLVSSGTRPDEAFAPAFQDRVGAPGGPIASRVPVAPVVPTTERPLAPEVAPEVVPRTEMEPSPAASVPDPDTEDGATEPPAEVAARRRSWAGVETLRNDLRVREMTELLRLDRSGADRLRAALDEFVAGALALLESTTLDPSGDARRTEGARRLQEVRDLCLRMALGSEGFHLYSEMEASGAFSLPGELPLEFLR